MAEIQKVVRERAEKEEDREYIIFSSDEDAVRWHNEVSRRRGLPKYGVNAATGEIDINSVQITDTYEKIIPDDIIDNRRAFHLDKQNVTDLIDENAKTEYKANILNNDDFKNSGIKTLRIDDLT